MPDTLSASQVPISPMPVPLRLKPNRHFPFLSRHPWVHAHAMQDQGENLAAGQVIDLLDHDGNWVARGLANPGSRLRVRLYSFDQSVALDESLIASRIDAAVRRRELTRRAGIDSITNTEQSAADGPSPDAERLVFSESDLLSGLIVDRYADCLSIQFTAGGLMRYRDFVLDHLRKVTGCQTIKFGVDPRTAKMERIDALDDWHGDQRPDGPIEYVQNGLRLTVNLSSGQKTGGYLDQRLNHRTAAGYLADRKVLDVCCYQGGFGLVAAAAGAKSVLGIDSSEPALNAARENAVRNGITNVDFAKEDCFDALKRRTVDGETFGAVILDPPRFAGSRHEVDAAMRAYLRLNSWAVDLLPPGGILVTCSCSGRVSRADFMDMLGTAGKKRRRDLVILESRGPAPDHPVAASCPESDYLKCIIAEVV